MNNIIEFYKRYVHIIVGVLFVLFIGKSCSKCSDERRYQFNVRNYITRIDSLNKVNVSKTDTINMLYDSLRIYKLELNNLEKKVNELSADKKHLQKSQYSLIQSNRILIRDKNKEQN